MRKHYSTIFLTLSIVSYVYSLTLLAFGCNYFGADSGRYLVNGGFELLVTGWLSVLAENFSWFANLGFFLGIVFWILSQRDSFYKDNIIDALNILNSITIALGLNALLLFLDKYNQKVGVYIGFYFWMLSFILLLLASLFAVKNKRTY